MFLAVAGDAWSADNDLRVDEQLLKNANVSSTGSGLIDFFRQRTLTDAHQAQLAEAIRRLGDASFALRQKASADLVAAGKSALPYLKKAVDDPDLEVARRAERCLGAIEQGANTSLTLAAARLLAARKPAGAVQVVLDFLPSAGDDLVEEEMLTTLAAVGLPDDKADPVLLAALKDRRLLCRAAAAHVLGASADVQHRQAVRPLLNDPEAKVRLRAAAGLIAGKDKEAIATLIVLLTDAPLPLALQAEELLCRLAGEQTPAVALSSGDEAERRKCRAAWSAWWTATGRQFDLAKVDFGQRLLGLTLIVVYDSNNGKGRVFEVGSDARPRWEITDVQGPVDAQVLPGNRVLIAEYNGRRFSERSLDGKILWEQKADAPPINCRRLSNGHTFLATTSRIQEINPAGKVIYTIASATSFYAARKLRNGHIAYLTTDGALFEVDESGKEVRKFQASNRPIGLLKFDVLPGGRYLVPQQTGGKVIEYDANGTSLWECALPNARVVSRLPNGNSLVCGHNGDRRVLEVDRGGRIVWEQKLEGHAHAASRR